MKKLAKSSLIGIISGFANGMFGSGGGSIAVPAMRKYLGLETHKAHATAIAVILPLCVVSMFFYLPKTSVGWTEILYVSIGGVFGGYTGSKLLGKLKSVWIHRIFGFCMLAAAIRLIVA